MRYNNLQLVNKCLEVVNYDEVTTITGNLGAETALSIIEDTYYDLVSRVDSKRNTKLGVLTATETTANPTTFVYDATSTDYTKLLKSFEYNIATTDYLTNPKFRELVYISPEDFLDKTDMANSDFTVIEVETNVLVKIRNNKQPQYYTSFDETTIYVDSYDTSIGTYLTTDRTRAMFERIPVFATGDTDVPVLESNYFPVLLSEAKSMCHAVLKDGVNSKVESTARRNRVLNQNDRSKERNSNARPDFGRR